MNRETAEARSSNDKKNEALLDREAVRQILAGRPAAFNDIVHRHGPALFRLAFQYLGNREEAEEQCQEILLKAFSRLDRYDPERRFFTWLYTIAVNHLRSEHRKRKIRKVRLPAAAYFESPLPERRLPGPEEELLRREARSIVRAAVNRLPRGYREVYLLRAVEELSVLETGEVLGIPEGTVKIRLRRAKQKLEKDLAGFLGFDETPGR